MGELTVTIEAYLVDYPSVKVSTTFQTSITACRVKEILAVTTPDIIYELGGTQNVFSIQEF